VVVVLLAAHQFLFQLRLEMMGLHHSSLILESHQLLLLEVEAAVEVIQFPATVFQVVLEVAAASVAQELLDQVEVEILHQHHHLKEILAELEIIVVLQTWLVLEAGALVVLVHHLLVHLLVVLAVMVHHHPSLEHQ